MTAWSDDCMVCGDSIEHLDWSHAFCSVLCRDTWQVERALADVPEPDAPDRFRRVIDKELSSMRARMRDQKAKP